MPVSILWPEEREVSEETVISWAKDYLADNPDDDSYFGENENKDNLSLITAMIILDDQGFVTFKK